MSSSAINLLTRIFLYLFRFVSISTDLFCYGEDENYCILGPIHITNNDYSFYERLQIDKYIIVTLRDDKN